MTLSVCDPCCDPVANSRSVDSSRTSILVALCKILSALTDGTSAASWVYSNTAYSSLGAAFASILTNSNKIRQLKLSNFTDQDIEISYDGTNVHDYIRAGEIAIRDLAANGRDIRTNVRARYVAAPSSGIFIASSMY